MCVVHGQHAIDLARRLHADVMVMDARMPRMDGVEATRAIRALPGAAGAVPIIALTAYALNEDRQWFMSLGFDGYISKPVSPSGMKDEIRRCLKEADENHARSNYHHGQ